MMWRKAASPLETAPARTRKPEASQESPGFSLQEVEARAAAAYQQGYSAGEEAAGGRANARLDPVIAGLNSVITELAGARRRFRAEAEEATVALAIAIARRVLHRELSSDPEAILGLVKAAFQRCDARETHRILLSPADAECVREHRGRLRIPEGLDIVADAALGRGAAVFETSSGDLDASVETQLIEIQRGFADVLKKRVSHG